MMAMGQHRRGGKGMRRFWGRSPRASAVEPPDVYRTRAQLIGLEQAEQVPFVRRSARDDDVHLLEGGAETCLGVGPGGPPGDDLREKRVELDRNFRTDGCGVVDPYARAERGV